MKFIRTLEKPEIFYYKLGCLNFCQLYRNQDLQYTQNRSKEEVSEREISQREYISVLLRDMEHTRISTVI